MSGPGVDAEAPGFDALVFGLVIVVVRSSLWSGLWPGFYSVELAGYYGQNGNNTKDLVGSSWFIYMPWWAIAILVAALAFITYYVRKIVLHIRSKSSKAKLKKRK